jgi:hypothetical protein
VSRESGAIQYARLFIARMMPQTILRWYGRETDEPGQTDL